METTRAKFLKTFIAIAIVGFFFSCSEISKDQVELKVEQGEILIDHDGMQYQTVVIDNQTWMAENMRVSHFPNGDPILQVTTNYEWFQASEQGIPAWRYPNDDPDLGKEWGKIYNGFAISDPRGLAPEGWKIPDMNDWQNLFSSLTSGESEPTKRASTLMSVDGEETEVLLNLQWPGVAPKLKGNDDTKRASLFKFQPSGTIDHYGNFYYQNVMMMWWFYSFDHPIFFMGEEINTQMGKIYLHVERDLVVSSPSFRNQGFAVRLVKE